MGTPVAILARTQPREGSKRGREDCDEDAPSDDAKRQEFAALNILMDPALCKTSCRLNIRSSTKSSSVRGGYDRLNVQEQSRKHYESKCSHCAKCQCTFHFSSTIAYYHRKQSISLTISRGHRPRVLARVFVAGHYGQQSLAYHHYYALQSISEDPLGASTERLDH